MGWKQRRKPPKAWEMPEHKERYDGLLRFFRLKYPDVPQTFRDGMAQQALEYEVNKQREQAQASTGEEPLGSSPSSIPHQP